MFTIPCEVYVKFANLAALASSDSWRVVRLEHVKGHKFAIASDRQNAVVYHLGETDQPDGSINIVADPVLIAACAKEIAYKSALEIIPVPALQIASAKTTFGYSHAGNVVNFNDETKLADWRKTYEAVKKTRGAMYWHVGVIERLARASMSGELRFPEHIDAAFPVLVCDVIDTNWIGFFMPNRSGNGATSEEVEPATLPGWAVAS